VCVHVSWRNYCWLSIMQVHKSIHSVAFLKLPHMPQVLRDKTLTYTRMCFSVPYNHFLLQWNWCSESFNSDTHTNKSKSSHTNIKIVKSKSKLKWLNKFNRKLCMALNISAHCTATHTYTKSVSLHVDITMKFLWYTRHTDVHWNWNDTHATSSHVSTYSFWYLYFS
jgi:hypothetical protein